MAMKTLTAEQKLALGALRESMGGISAEKRDAQKHLLAARKSIQKFLESRTATVPEIAAALNMPSDEAFWHITGMRKYGKVAEAGEDGDYVLYALAGSEDNQPASH